MTHILCRKRVELAVCYLRGGRLICDVESDLNLFYIRPLAECFSCKLCAVCILCYCGDFSVQSVNDDFYSIVVSCVCTVKEFVREIEHERLVFIHAGWLVFKVTGRECFEQCNFHLVVHGIRAG